MKYEYQGIKLGDSIEKIINLLNNENTSFDDFYSYLIYEPGSAIEDITSKIHVYLYTGTVVRIQIFDEEYCLAEDLKIGTPIDVDKREIYGQLDNYKFTFDLVTRDIKSIQNLETEEFLKTYN